MGAQRADCPSANTAAHQYTVDFSVLASVAHLSLSPLVLTSSLKLFTRIAIQPMAALVVPGLQALSVCVHKLKLLRQLWQLFLQNILHIALRMPFTQHALRVGH